MRLVFLSIIIKYWVISFFTFLWSQHLLYVECDFIVKHVGFIPIHRVLSMRFLIDVFADWIYFWYRKMFLDDGFWIKVRHVAVEVWLWSKWEFVKFDVSFVNQINFYLSLVAFNVVVKLLTSLFSIIFINQFNLRHLSLVIDWLILFNNSRWLLGHLIRIEERYFWYVLWSIRWNILLHQLNILNLNWIWCVLMRFSILSLDRILTPKWGWFNSLSITLQSSFMTKSFLWCLVNLQIFFFFTTFIHFFLLFFESLDFIEMNF